MSIDWTHFTPEASLTGGLLIGLAASVLVLFDGRIAGISGILGGVLRPRDGDLFWRLAFLIGLVAAPLIWRLAAPLPESRIEATSPILVLAGLAVGLGTRAGAGCTSGHGVCGLSRMSPRSLVATLCFMTEGFLTVFVVRHLLAG